MVYIIFLCLSIPLGLMLPLLETRSRYLLGFLLLGALAAKLLVYAFGKGD